MIGTILQVRTSSSSTAALINTFNALHRLSPTTTRPSVGFSGDLKGCATMMESWFCFRSGAERRIERNLWQRGIGTWVDCFHGRGSLTRTERENRRRVRVPSSRCACHGRSWHPSFRHAVVLGAIRLSPLADAPLHFPPHDAPLGYRRPAHVQRRRVRWRFIGGGVHAEPLDTMVGPQA